MHCWWNTHSCKRLLCVSWCFVVLYVHHSREQFNMTHESCISIWLSIRTFYVTQTHSHKKTLKNARDLLSLFTLSSEIYLNAIVKSTVTNSWTPLLLLRANLLFPWSHSFFFLFEFNFFSCPTKCTCYTCFSLSTDRTICSKWLHTRRKRERKKVKEENVFKSTFQQLSTSMNEQRVQVEWNLKFTSINWHVYCFRVYFECMCKDVCYVKGGEEKKNCLCWLCVERRQVFSFFIAFSDWYESSEGTNGHKNHSDSRPSGCKLRALEVPMSKLNHNLFV